MQDRANKRLNLGWTLLRRGRYGLSVVVLGVLAASALGASAVQSAARPDARFALRGAPSRQVVAAGAWTRYRIAVSRRGFRGVIKLSVAGAPRYARARLETRRDSLRTLTVVTSRRTPSGRYRLRVRARGGENTSVIRLVLTIHGPKVVPIAISGTVSGLQPGAPKALDLALRNGGREWLWITSLRVTAKHLSAPRASALLPCTLADFSTRQFSGIYPLVLRPLANRSLSSLGVPPAQRPQVTLVDRPTNQDGCQGATVTLTYDARGMTI